MFVTSLTLRVCVCFDVREKGSLKYGIYCLKLSRFHDLFSAKGYVNLLTRCIQFNVDNVCWCIKREALICSFSEFHYSQGTRVVYQFLLENLTASCHIKSALHWTRNRDSITNTHKKETVLAFCIFWISISIWSLGIYGSVRRFDCETSYSKECLLFQCRCVYRVSIKSVPFWNEWKYKQGFHSFYLKIISWLSKTSEGILRVTEN